MQTNLVTSKTSKLVMTAMMMCMIMVAIFLFRIPIPFTQGYVNLSDAIIFIGILVLGWKYGMIAAALGSMLGDIIGGFAMWAPWTLGIKAGMAIIAGTLICGLCKKEGISDRTFVVLEILSMVAGGLFMVFGYYIGEGVMYGSWAVAALGVPWNICQFSVGIALCLVLTEPLKKTSFRKFFTYKKRSH
ncbi:MAG: ECF transporter S component [Bacillota bacterium]|nr:ECF transporter S component [Bacillota bacterium]